MKTFEKRGNIIDIRPHLQRRRVPLLPSVCQEVVLDDSLAPEIVNHTVLGREIADFADHNVDIFREHNLCHGFFDGGCLAFASALLMWIGNLVPARLVYCGRRGIGDHVVVEMEYTGRKFYLDADGLATADEIVKKMKNIELSHYGEDVLASVGIYDWRPSEFINDYSDIGLPDAFAERLEKNIGPFSIKLLSC